MWKFILGQIKRNTFTFAYYFTLSWLQLKMSEVTEGKKDKSATLIILGKTLNMAIFS